MSEGEADAAAERPVAKPMRTDRPRLIPRERGSAFRLPVEQQSSIADRNWPAPSAASTSRARTSRPRRARTSSRRMTAAAASSRSDKADMRCARAIAADAHRQMRPRHSSVRRAAAHRRKACRDPARRRRRWRRKLSVQAAWRAPAPANARRKSAASVPHREFHRRQDRRAGWHVPQCRRPPQCRAPQWPRQNAAQISNSTRAPECCPVP